MTDVANLVANAVSTAVSNTVATAVTTAATNVKTEATAEVNSLSSHWHVPVWGVLVVLAVGVAVAHFVFHVVL